MIWWGQRGMEAMVSQFYFLPSIHLSAFISGEYFVQVHLCVILGGLFIRFGRWFSPTEQGITEITVECHSSSYYSFFSSFFLNLCFLLYFSSSKHAWSHWVGVWVCGLHCKQLRFVVVGVWAGLQQSTLEVLQQFSVWSMISGHITSCGLHFVLGNGAFSTSSRWHPCFSFIRSWLDLIIVNFCFLLSCL